MTDEEQKAWEVTVHRANQVNEFFSVYDANAILAADAELKRLREAVEGIDAFLKEGAFIDASDGIIEVNHWPDGHTEEKYEVDSIVDVVKLRRRAKEG